MKRIPNFTGTIHDFNPDASNSMRVFTTFLLLITLKTFSQNFPKREFRGAWIATVSNIDFPSSKNLSAAQQQAEFVNLLDQHRRAGLNAVLVQIRCNSDALYDSPLEPWAEWLTGTQGKSPGYDPLAFMIAECRRRNLEFHAWFNPYRAVSNVVTSKIDSTKHVAVKHPDWLLAYGNLRILDPGHPAARQWVTHVVMDVVRRYDIDGVHFDDYFYPYPTTGLTLNDDATYAAYNRGITNRADWRRDNVNLLIKAVSDSINRVKPYVKFGISPFGIWQNKSGSQPLGSETRGSQSYHDIFADSPLWLKNGWVDYLAPQLYWYIGYSVADYGLLAPWWSNLAAGRHIYSGQAVYRVNADANWDAAQIPKQIRLNRSLPGMQGSILYNTTYLNRNPLGVRDSLIANYFRYPALPPLMPWKPNLPPPPPTDLSARLTDAGVQLVWAAPRAPTQELEKVRSYAVYRFVNGEPQDFENAKALRAILPAIETSYVDTETRNFQTATYAVRAINRLQVESSATPAATVAKPLGITDDPAGLVLHQNIPNPFTEHTLIRYYLPRGGHVRIRLLDALGKTVSYLVDKPQPEGVHELIIYTSDLRQGFYFYSLEFEDKRLVRKLISQ